MGRWARARGRLLPLVRWVALFVFAFGLGIFYAATNSQQIKGLVMTVQVALNLGNRTGNGNWFPARFERSGVLRQDKARAQPGDTLYAVAADLSVHLVDMDGRELHRWSVKRDEVMPGAARESRTFFGRLEAQLEGRYLYPNGDLLTVYEQQATGDWGGPVIKLDKQSRILWKADVHSHHALKVVGDRIYVLDQKFVPPSPPPSILPSLEGMPYIEDYVTVLDADGKVLRSASVLQAVAKSKAFRFDEIVPPNDRADPLHTNALDVLTAQTASAIQGAKPGDVLISLKHIDMLAVMDLETDTIVWALRGSWRAQHDAKVLANGHILLLDNQGGLGRQGRSRALEIDPRTGGIVWSYEGTDDDKLDTDIRGGVERLANGNTLIAESTAGRILEVTPDRQVVWEFVQPIGDVEHDRKIVAALGLNVERYEPGSLPFLNADGHEAAR